MGMRVQGLVTGVGKGSGYVFARLGGSGQPCQARSTTATAHSEISPQGLVLTAHGASNRLRTFSEPSLLTAQNVSSDDNSSVRLRRNKPLPSSLM